MKTWQIVLAVYWFLTGVVWYCRITDTEPKANNWFEHLLEFILGFLTGGICVPARLLYKLTS